MRCHNCNSTNTELLDAAPETELWECLSCSRTINCELEMDEGAALDWYWNQKQDERREGRDDGGKGG